MSDYITDPEILNRLNSPRDEYVSDPAILAKLNATESAKTPPPPDRLRQFGQTMASFADTVLGAPAAIGQQIGYGVGRAFGLSPEEATAASLKTTQPFMNPVGEAFGVTQTPGYQSEASRALPAAAVGAVAPPIAQATGLPQQDIESMLGSATLAAAPAMARGAGAAGRAAYAAEPVAGAIARAPITAAKAPFQFAKGFTEGVLNPEYRPATSAQVPLKSTYFPEAAVDRYMGNMPGVAPQTLEQLMSQSRPTSELTSSTAAQLALKTVPKTAAGEPLVPLQGRGVEAWGERVGRGVRTQPLQAMADIGLGALTGIPIKTLGQATSGAASSYLGGKTGFAPGFTEKLAQDQAQAAQTAQQALTPKYPPALPAPGPVAPTTIPMGTAPRQVNIEGQSFKLPYDINVSNSQPAGPAAIAQQAAAAKVQGAVPGATVQDIAAAKISPEGQAMLDQIRARGEAQKMADLQKRAAASFGSQYKPPAMEAAPPTPVAGPAVPETAPPAPTPAVAPTTPSTTSAMDKLKSRLKPMTAEEQAAVEAYNALPKTEKAAQTRAERKSEKEASAQTPKQEVYGSVNKPLGPKKAKDLMDEKDAAGEKYTIYYKEKGQDLTAKGGQMTAEFDPELKLTRLVSPDSGLSIGQGTYQGKPVTLEINLATGRGKLYNVNRKILKIYGNEQ